MRRLRAFVPAVLCGALLVVPATVAESAAAPADLTVTVSATGTSSWPAYDEDVSRFAVSTTDATDGRLTVRATTTDPEGVVRVNGQRVTNGADHVVSGLVPGDEVNVQVSDSDGTSNQSWFYLPPGFPTITTTSAGEGPEPGHNLLTLGGEGPDFMTAVDEHGVPAFALPSGLGAGNLALQPDGRLAVALATVQNDLWGDWQVRRLDARNRLEPEVFRMIGHPKTDFHDFVFLPGGGRILMAYVQRQDGQTDSWVQEVGPDGAVELDWNSADHVDESVDVVSNALGDYAHLNSIEIMDDGNLLLSFRHLSQVMKIDRDTGEVIWRLGGIRSDFTFDDDPLGGPCAQHTARELGNGDIQIFDNGSVDVEPMCPNPADPDGPRIGRPESRVTVYRLDEEAGTASLVEQRMTGSFNRYAGSSDRLGESVEDHLLMGLNEAYTSGGAMAPDAIELDGDGNQVWSLSAAGSSSYRVQRATVADKTPPVIRVRGLTDGAMLVDDRPRVVEHWCTDTGGSNLASCTASPVGGRELSAGLGKHRLTLTATDRAGNSTTRHLDYTVRAARQPDVAVRRGSGAAWIGAGVLPPAQQVLERTLTQRRATTYFRVRNTGARADRLRVVGTRGTARYAARWWKGGSDVTGRLTAGLRTPLLQPGQVWTVRVVVTRSRTAPKGSSRTFALRATSVGTPARVDVARVRTTR